MVTARTAAPTSAPSTRAVRRREEVVEEEGTTRCMGHPSRRLQARADHGLPRAGRPPSTARFTRAGPGAPVADTFTAEQDRIGHFSHAESVLPDQQRSVD